MNYSERGLDLTRCFEGCRFRAYRDGGGVLTIGYGHTKGVREGQECDMPQAIAWLRQDVLEALLAVFFAGHHMGARSVRVDISGSYMAAPAN